MLKGILFLKDTVQRGDISSLIDTSPTAEALRTMCICTCVKRKSARWCWPLTPALSLHSHVARLQLRGLFRPPAGSILTRLKRLASPSPMLLLTPGGYTCQYFHFSRPINVSRSRLQNSCSSVTSACWQERRPQHLIWPVSFFQDADAAQGQGIQGVESTWSFYNAHCVSKTGLLLNMKAGITEL